MSPSANAFQENLSSICEEFYLAKQWGKASIILTIHKSLFSQEKTKKALREKLVDLGYSVVDILFHKVQSNFVEYLLQTEDIENTVFFIGNIDWGGGKDDRDAYRILNLHRETFVNQKIKAVFFLTIQEASNLPTYAPDFWAFRHRVLEFATPHAPSFQHPPSGLLHWHLASPVTSISDVKNKISNYAQLLADIPIQAESVSSRVDLNYELGFLHWYAGDYPSAEHRLTDGINLAKEFEFNDPLAQLTNGLAIIQYELGNYQEAMELIETGLAENPLDWLLILNQAMVLSAMKKRYHSIRRGEKALSIFNQSPWAWNSMGFLYYLAGKTDNAIECMQKAIAISPTSGYFYESLALCYLAKGLTDKAREQLHQARANSGNRRIIQSILEASIEGGAKGMLHHIKMSKDAGKLTDLDLFRDPTLHILIALNKTR